MTFTVTMSTQNMLKRHMRSKSRELRGGTLYVGCVCGRHFGLQDDCPRCDCHGSPECLTDPPTCGPAEFNRWKMEYRNVKVKENKKVELS